MAQFMLLLHETPGTFAQYSPEEIQAIIEKYGAWSAKLAAAGKLKGGSKLRDEGGKHVSKPKGKETLSVVDGPYVETKEVIGGFFMIEADDYAEATELVADCPHLHWGTVEIRETDPMAG